MLATWEWPVSLENGRDKLTWDQALIPLGELIAMLVCLWIIDLLNEGMLTNKVTVFNIDPTLLAPHKSHGLDGVVMELFKFLGPSINQDYFQNALGIHF